jgi:hypothetical protein
MTVQLLKVQDAINDVLLLIDEAWEVASMMRIAARVADIAPATSASALASLLELAQVRGGAAAKAAADLRRHAKMPKR